jgi:Flp pilus assembly protein TadD
MLRSATDDAPGDASLHYALGLALVRQKSNDAALVELKRATELAPDQSRYAYVYAIGVHSAGRVDDAISVLKDNLNKHPTDRDSLTALVSFHRETGNIASALDYATRLARIAPNDRQIAALVESLRRQMENAPR